MALPLLQRARRRSVVVYDCMDELSAFRTRRGSCCSARARCCKIADLVFTGGPSLYRAKRDRHPTRALLSRAASTPRTSRSARDRAHRAPASSGDCRSPRLGFFGVIDERLDLDARSTRWPTARPRLADRAWSGRSSRSIRPRCRGARTSTTSASSRTQELPRFLAGWDVCLLPFALNEATRFISPTKTLEYMAAEQPIVSTPITDVVEPYGDIVHIGRRRRRRSSPPASARCARRADERARARRAMRAAWSRDLVGRDGRADADADRRAPRRASVAGRRATLAATRRAVERTAREPIASAATAHASSSAPARPA